MQSLSKTFLLVLAISSVTVTALLGRKCVLEEKAQRAGSLPGSQTIPPSQLETTAAPPSIGTDTPYSPENSKALDRATTVQDESSITSLEADRAPIELSASSINRWGPIIQADCQLKSVADCRRLAGTFDEVLKSADDSDDGWSGWMEGEIHRSLTEKAKENRFSQTGMKCNANGCVFFIAAHSAREMFGDGWSYFNDFDEWLRHQSWNEWLQVNKKGNDQSTLAWRLNMSLYQSPFINWYVVTRRPN